MKKIITDLGNGNEIIRYDILNLQEFKNSKNPILAVQKSVIGKWLSEILNWVWIEVTPKILEENIWRAWFFSIESKKFWEIWILATKWADSTKSFAKISDYYLWWTDIGDKVQARWLKLAKLEEILWEKLWWYKTELLLLLWERVVKNINSNTELDILTTKFTPTLTKKVIEQLPNNMKKPIIDTVDSNSELNIQIQEILNPNKNVGAIEIVQSWKSLLATNAYPVRDWKIYKSSLRDKKTWEFFWEIIWELDKNSQIWKIALEIQSEINLTLYKILSSNNKTTEFINAIKESMRKFNADNQNKYFTKL